MKKLEQRKLLILETFERLQRPIWIGDLHPRSSEHAAFAAAFRELERAGVLDIVRGTPGRRVHYHLRKLESAFTAKHPAGARVADEAG